MPKTTPFRALLGLELRRAAPGTFRFLIAVIGVTVVLMLIGRGTAQSLSLLWIGLTMGYLVQVPLSAMRDKIEGSMTFLCGLPTTATTLANARLAAAALIATPATLHVVLAARLVLPLMGLDPTVGLLVAVAATAWIWFTALISLATALLIRFPVHTLTGTPLLVAALVGFAGTVLFDRWVPNPAAHLEALLRTGWFLPFLSLTPVALAAGILLTSWRLMIAGFTNYRPSRDQLEW